MLPLSTNPFKLMATNPTPVVKLPDTCVTADEFIKLFFDGCILEEDDAKRLANVKRFHARMREIKRNQDAAKGGPHHNN